MIQTYNSSPDLFSENEIYISSYLWRVHMVSSYRQFANIMSTVQFWYRDYPPWNPKLASLLNKDPLPQSFRHCGPLLLPQW